MFFVSRSGTWALETRLPFAFVFERLDWARCTLGSGTKAGAAYSTAVFKLRAKPNIAVTRTRSVLSFHFRLQRKHLILISQNELRR